MALVVVALLWGALVHVSRRATSTGRSSERQKEISRKLPDILDLLVISVEAGLGFEQALDRTTAPRCPARCPTSSAACCTRSASVRPGPTRCARWPSAATCPSCARFILAMLQADTFGVSISRLLRSQADEMRIRRRLRAQEQAQKAPVKMLFPLVFCIFPSIFVVILGPAMIQISRRLLRCSDGRAPTACARADDADALAARSGRRRRRARRAVAAGGRPGSTRSSPPSSRCSAGRSASSELSDNSFFWHLRTGEYILDHGIPHHDVFSFTAPGTKWVAQSWLAEVHLRRARTASSARSASGCFVRLVGAAHRRARVPPRAAPRPRPGASPCGITVAALAGIYTLWSERPLLLGVLFFLVLLWIVEVPDSLVGRHPLDRRCPVLIWLWANVHGTLRARVRVPRAAPRSAAGSTAHRPWEGRERPLLVGARDRRSR